MICMDYEKKRLLLELAEIEKNFAENGKRARRLLESTKAFGYKNAEVSIFITEDRVKEILEAINDAKQSI